MTSSVLIKEVDIMLDKNLVRNRFKNLLSKELYQFKNNFYKKY
ncbi:hypothetical protein CNEO4_360031 [Clostridium neonatale]|uniref:Uncharacterized protein n=1 Tax=Clostridium neonatale TaxID=137838 RepID=A0AA86JNL2_9CLOT|nr:hypothetical protein CNEO_44975 [Clostridium neonatale]CAI3633809.1 hypothetical protein CNEO4_360031 [Clostridium neonatale]CAI3684372.1 hypothetical protein CNEO4_540005 [Clostridium neonatale]CAI3692355.1 hypothetical protein CNEO2_490030 [Clostridium neonatale]